MKFEEAFETEIAFWQTLIDSQSEDTPREVTDRMKLAKALAEQKLSLIVSGFELVSDDSDWTQ